MLDEIDLPPPSPLLSKEGEESTTLGGGHDYVIYELSSYMLQDFSPHLQYGLLNNIYPAHLDWHYDSYGIYKEAKSNSLKNAQYKIVHGNFSALSEIADIP